MAEIYLAEQCSLRRQVAFKVLKSSLADDESYVQRFHNEAQAVASLVHANIVQIHEVGCIDGVHFIAQEYVPGQNLRQVLTRRGPFDVTAAVSVMRQVAAALHKAGHEGIIHRDVKPENILVATNGEVKVADFGLARIAGPGAVSLTQVGVTMGTPLYMSPEQVEGKAVDPRSDIYSFGVTCYQMLAGRPPFEGETALSVAVQHLEKKPERLENHRPDLPEGLCRVVHKMLAKDPGDRYEHAAGLLHALRELAIEGADTDWAEALGEWTVPELIALADTRVEATQRLDALMKTSALAIQRRGRYRRAAVIALMAAAFAFLTGAAAAWITREPYLLDAAQEGAATLVERRESPEAQYIYAVMLNTEPAWRSVWEHFPPEADEQNQYYARRAKQQLARLHLKNDDLDLALNLYEELAALDPAEQEFRAFGLAGQAMVYSLKGDQERSAAKVAAVWELREHLDPQMRAQIERLARNGRDALRQPPTGP